MSCCTCCCENKGRVCCNSVCCQEAETCCGTTCCPDTRVCCEGVCCAEGETCCGGECCPEGYNCCGGVCQPDPCNTCAQDSDCDYFLVTVDGYANAGCDATYLNAFFGNYDDAYNYGLPYSTDGDCGTVTITPVYGLCCDDACYPDYGSLPFYTNLEPGELACP